jgi:hypothetical protein
MDTIIICTEFYHRLVNRDKYQGDGLHHAQEFREKYLGFLDSDEKWKNEDKEIILDFNGVKKIGPSFANEAFAYFAKYARPDLILKKIKFVNISEVQEAIIRTELDSGYDK